ncbi:MAG: tail fiber domain-containing protein [Bacteroidia bacterium]
MKKVFSSFAFAFSIICAFAQSPPQGINYQAVARNTSGGAIISAPLNVRFTIHAGSASGGIDYQETHSVTTNVYGLFTAVIGGGASTGAGGAFNTINWGAGTKFLEVEVDDGSGYVSMGASQMMSVPYALYSQYSTNGPTGATGPTSTVPGPTGPTGPTGAGTTGATGATGPSGVDGVTGPTGPTGAGIAGATGATGATGTAGATGANGATGPTGATGSTGPVGDQYATTSATSMAITMTPHTFTVSTGLAYSVGQTVIIANSPGFQMVGDITSYNPGTGVMSVNVTSVSGSGSFSSWSVNLNGAPGPAGPTGATGVAGSTGSTGSAGPTGPTGSAGSAGATGATGPAGVAGSTGSAGSAGPTGPTGSAGSAGATGATGPTGTAGSTGTAGATGPAGATGTTGATGSAGSTGATGPIGPTGAPGSAGATGATGSAGGVGPTGPTGPNWTLSTLTFNAAGTLTLNGTAGSGGPITTGNAVWNTIGNSGTSPSTNFIGTTDAADFVLRANNTERMRISASNGSIGIGTALPSASAMLDVSSTTKGILVPRMTTAQRLAIGAAATGLLVYDNSLNQFFYYNGASWVAIGSGSGTVTSVATGIGLVGGPITTAGTISLANTSVTAGTYGTPTSVPQITVDAQGRLTSAGNIPISGIMPSGTNGQTLYYGSGAWNASSNLFHDGVNVGIGTTTPGIIGGSTKYLTVSSGTGSPGSSDATSLELHGGGASPSSVQAKIDFIARATDGNNYNTGRIEMTNTPGSTLQGQMHFYTKNAGSITERMKIDENGVVSVATLGGTGGIVVANPGGTLSTVTGTPVTGSGTANYIPKWNASGTGLTATSAIFDSGTGVGIGTNAPTQTLQVVNTAASPAVSIVGNSTSTMFLLFGTTGFNNKGAVKYDNGTNNMELWTNNSTRMTIDGNGHFGLNGPPDATHTILEYNGGGNPGIGLDNSGVTIGDVYTGSLGNYFYTDYEGAGNFQFINGKVGIGTTAPVNLLDVTAGVAIGAAYAGVTGAPANGLIVQGNVGIGTNGPSDNLHIFKNINSSTGITIQNTNTGSSSSERISFDNEDGSVAGIQMNDIASTTPGAMTFFNNRPSGNIRLNTGGNTKMYIGNNGFVGIGNNFISPAGVLHVKGADWSVSPVIFEATPTSAGATTRYNAGTRIFDVIGSTGSGASMGAGYYGIYDATSSAYRFTIAPSGNIGIGVNSAAYLLELVSNSAGKPGSTTWTVTSDERLKNIHGAYTKGLNEILALQPITYNYKNVGDRQFPDDVLSQEFAGFSAQEVQKVFPEAVKTGADGYLNFDIHPILIAYVNAIKEQQKQIEELKKKMEEQQKQIDKLLNVSGSEEK